MSTLGDFTSWGRFYGFPECCISNFCTESPFGRPKRKLSGTGYVPCPACNEKTEEELVAAIAARRHPSLRPFPDARFVADAPRRDIRLVDIGGKPHLAIPKDTALGQSITAWMTPPQLPNLRALTLPEALAAARVIKLAIRYGQPQSGYLDLGPAPDGSCTSRKVRFVADAAHPVRVILFQPGKTRCPQEVHKNLSAFLEAYR